MAQTADTSFEGVTFSAAQQAILNADITRINNEIVNLSALLKTKGDLEAAQAFYDNRPPSQDKDNNLASISTARTQNNSQIAIAQNNLNNNTDGLHPNSYIAVYNEDLRQIQNAIKLGIQASQANANAANNTPAVILATNQANLEKAQKAAELKAAERATTIKYGFFVIITIALIFGAIKLIKN